MSELKNRDLLRMEAFVRRDARMLLKLTPAEKQRIDKLCNDLSSGKFRLARGQCVMQAIALLEKEWYGEINPQHLF